MMFFASQKWCCSTSFRSDAMFAPKCGEATHHSQSEHHWRSQHQLPKACISSATCCGISSTRSVVYHQAAGEMHASAWWDTAPQGLMICTALRAVMICQVCDLDKKSDKAYLVGFLAYPNGFEPSTFRVGVWRAIQLCHGQICIGWRRCDMFAMQTWYCFAVICASHVIYLLRKCDRYFTQKDDILFRLIWIIPQKNYFVNKYIKNVWNYGYNMLQWFQ